MESIDESEMANQGGSGRHQDSVRTIRRKFRLQVMGAIALGILIAILVANFAFHATMLALATLLGVSGVAVPLLLVGLIGALLAFEIIALLRLRSLSTFAALPWELGIGVKVSEGSRFRVSVTRLLLIGAVILGAGLGLFIPAATPTLLAWIVGGVGNVAGAYALAALASAFVLMVIVGLLAVRELRLGSRQARREEPENRTAADLTQLDDSKSKISAHERNADFSLTAGGDTLQVTGMPLAAPKGVEKRRPAEGKRSTRSGLDAAALADQLGGGRKVKGSGQAEVSDRGIAGGEDVMHDSPLGSRHGSRRSSASVVEKEQKQDLALGHGLTKSPPQSGEDS